jgi:RND superfamily putative drug exporter
VVLMAAATLGSRVTGDWAEDGRLPGTDSQRAADLLEAEFPARGGEDATIVFSDAGRDREAIDAYLGDVARVSGVSAVDPIELSPDGQIAIARVTLDDTDTDTIPTTVDRIADLADPLRERGVEIEFANGWFLEESMPASEAIGLLAAIVVLLVAFGSVLAMGLPIVTALVGIGIGVTAVGIVANIVPTPEFSPQVATMIGIGVGIDYALIIVTRYREALSRGALPEAAVVEALATAGRAVVFAGCTVVISLLGMFVMGLDFLHGLALGTSFAVAVAVAAAITLLPALLGFLGPNINRLRIGRRTRSTRASTWSRWAAFVQRRPAPIAAVGLLVLVVAALPVIGMRLGVADAGNDPPGSTTRAAYELVARGFGPGTNGPIVAAVDARAAGPSDLASLRDAIAATPGVESVGEARWNDAGTTAVVSIVPTTGPQDPATVELLHDLRDDVVPAAIEDTGVLVYLGGLTASDIDFSTVIASRLPWFIGSVLALSFLLLLVVFRSVLVPIKAVLMNLLSIGAAYGVMVAIFQWGWMGGVFGVSAAPIEAWVPMLLFAIVFGLSMDYEVFLLSAVREQYDRTGDNRVAVSRGLASTARVITAAALIMVCVFGSFVFSDIRGLKLVGLGLAVAVAVDATIVRIVLVPATMDLLGRANWWLPRWLDRLLPSVDLDGHRTAGHLATTSSARTTDGTQTSEDDEPDLVALR